MSNEAERLRRAIAFRDAYMEGDPDAPDEVDTMRRVVELIGGLVLRELEEANEDLRAAIERHPESDDAFVDALKAQMRRSTAMEAEATVRALIHGYDHPVHNIRIAGASSFGLKVHDERRRLRDAALLGWHDYMTKDRRACSSNEACRIAARVLNQIEPHPDPTKEITINSIKGRLQRARKWNAPQPMHDHYWGVRRGSAKLSDPERALMFGYGEFACPRVMLRIIDISRP